ncbi:MAG: shikimate kinase [Bacteroidetes bacterium]|nr:MAG: shikimate kinase [Bacteroidota bacterium]
MKVFLIGFMGSGKSYWAERLSEQMSIPHYDLDEIMETKYGMRISEMFESWGEAEFRTRESETIRSFAFSDGILACGGGTPCFHDTMDFLLSEGMVVYLKASVPVLYQRLFELRKHRPVLAQVQDENLESSIAKLLEKRAQFYAKAHVTIDTANSTIEEVIHILNS